jgi:hypothetical protein
MSENFTTGSVEDFDFGYSAEEYDTKDSRYTVTALELINPQLRYECPEVNCTRRFAAGYSIDCHIRDDH